MQKRQGENDCFGSPGGPHLASYGNLTMKNGYLISHNEIVWPEIPETPPQHLRYWVGNRRDIWQKQAAVLWLVAQGYTVGREILHLLAHRFGTTSTSGAMGRLLPRMVRNCLLKQEMPCLTQHRSARLVTLDSMGDCIARDLGWERHATEWEQMRERHEKGKSGETRHTLSVLWFTWNARLRGYAAGVVPDLEDTPRFIPDAILEQDGEQILVEVERGTPDLSKWQNMVDYQGFIAFCARNPSHRQRLVDQIRYEIGGTGMATDIQTLLNETWAGDEISPLWAQTW